MSYTTFRWSSIAADYASSFFRNRIWTNALPRFPSALGLPPLPLGIIGRNGDIEYITDLSSWKAFHEEIVRRSTKDPRFLDRKIDEILTMGDDVVRWSRKHIFSAPLERYSNRKLWSLFEIFVEKLSTLTLHGVIIALADFQHTRFIEDNLDRILHANVFPSEYATAYDAFTYPLHNSYAEDQEEDLLRLMDRWYANARWRRDVRRLPFSQLKTSYPDFARSLSRHTSRYAWVYYVFTGPAYTEEHFLEFIQDALDRRVAPRRLLRRIERRKAEIQRRKKRYLQEFSLPSFDRTILSLAAKVVWSKPRRKDMESRALYCSERLLREIAKRLSVTMNQARSIPFEMLRDALCKNAPLDIHLVNAVARLHACLPNRDESITVLVGDDVKTFEKTVKRMKGRGKHSRHAVQGTPAVRGKVRGIVKIITRPSDMAKMERGDVLVSSATTPNLVPAMKKAAAIVTDEGGLTCHASIVSRELNIPCVVGTTFATSVFRDGDRVEVDANRGTVTKIT